MHDQPVCGAQATARRAEHVEIGGFFGVEAVQRRGGAEAGRDLVAATTGPGRVTALVVGLAATVDSLPDSFQ